MRHSVAACEALCGSLLGTLWQLARHSVAACEELCCSLLGTLLQLVRHSVAACEALCGSRIYQQMCNKVGEYTLRNVLHVPCVNVYLESTH